MALNIAVVAIGSEILTGFTINTNAALIGQALLAIGLRVTSQCTVADDKESIQTGLRETIAKNDLIICTGGLGPTCDDVTRQYIAELFGCELRLEPKIVAYLEQRYKNRPVSIENQAMIPSKAQYILNELGTASALIFTESGKLIIFLPGVPAELEHFINKDIIPMLMEKFPNERSEFRQQIYFMQLSESQIDPTLRALLKKYPSVDFGIYPNLGLISVHIISKFPTEQDNIGFQAPIKDELIAIFKDNFYSDSEKSIEKVICNLCKKSKYTISLQENSPYLNLRSRLGPVLSTANGDIHVAITNVPEMTTEEAIYEAEVNVTITMHGQAPILSHHKLRGNKRMFSTRCEHAALCEIFKVLRANGVEPSGL